jgi:hypothetical protein
MLRLLHARSLAQEQLLQAKRNLQRMLANIPLTEDERAAVTKSRSAARIKNNTATIGTVSLGHKRVDATRTWSES